MLQKSRPENSDFVQSCVTAEIIEKLLTGSAIMFRILKSKGVGIETDCASHAAGEEMFRDMLVNGEINVRLEDVPIALLGATARNASFIATARYGSSWFYKRS